MAPENRQSFPSSSQWIFFFHHSLEAFVALAPRIASISLVSDSEQNHLGWGSFIRAILSGGVRETHVDNDITDRHSASQSWDGELILAESTGGGAPNLKITAEQKRRRRFAHDIFINNFAMFTLCSVWRLLL